MTEMSHVGEFNELINEYFSNEFAVLTIDQWTTEDLVRAAELIDVELMERAFQKEFQSPFDEVASDDC